MNVLTIVVHPRTDSLTFTVAQRFVDGLRRAGQRTDVLDLYRSGFDPVLREPDEPDWSAGVQRFSPQVESEMERLRKYDGLAFVFPLWWWSVPAILKGYVDRVWNYGFAYGNAHLPHSRVLWLGLAGAPPVRFEKRKYDEMIRRYFEIGLGAYVGIQHTRVELLYGTIQKNARHTNDWLTTAHRLGLEYATAERHPLPEEERLPSLAPVDEAPLDDIDGVTLAREWTRQFRYRDERRRERDVKRLTPVAQSFLTLVATAEAESTALDPSASSGPGRTPADPHGVPSKASPTPAVDPCARVGNVVNGCC